MLWPTHTRVDQAYRALRSSKNGVYYPDNVFLRKTLRRILPSELLLRSKYRKWNEPTIVDDRFLYRSGSFTPLMNSKRLKLLRQPFRYCMVRRISHMED
ncbi:hypothetical protein SprV_0802481200 [Sparganum proliferum]